MWATKRILGRQSAVCIGLLFMATAVGPAIAQDAPTADPSASPREQELREQLNNILKELDELQQQKEHATPEGERPSIIKEQAEPVSPEATAEGQPTGLDFDLADM